jgi:DNA-binding GntR family transcriptional regulator
VLGSDEVRKMGDELAIAERSTKRQGEVVVDLAEQIKGAILNGEFVPGELLRESAIIAKFGSSRTSTREAFRLVINSGLAQKSPNQSYRVRTIEDRDLFELSTLRLQFEYFATRLAFGRPAFIKGMRAAVDDMREAVARGNKVEAFTANRRFHEAMIDAADHNRLTVAYANIADQVEFAFLSHGGLERGIEGLVGEHELLIGLAAAGDLGGFLDELQRHVEGGFQLATGMPLPDIVSPIENSRDDHAASPTGIVASVGQLGW